MNLAELIVKESRKETSSHELTQLRRELCDAIDRGFGSAPDDLKKEALVDGLNYLDNAAPQDLAGKSIGKVLATAELESIAALKKH